MADDDIAIRLIMFIRSSRQRGMSDGAIQAQLVEAGMTDADAARAIGLVPASASADTWSSPRGETWTSPRREGNGDIFLGVILLFLGIVITAVTYSSASKGGGHYVVMTGLIVVGIIRIVKGLSRR